MADEPIEEPGDFALEFRGLGLKLRNGIGESVRHLHVLAPQLLKQLHVMVAGNTDCGSGCDHPHYESQYLGNLRAPIYQITKEDCLSPLGHPDLMPIAVLLDRITKGRHQFQEFIEASMNIADDVEGPVLISAIRPHRLPHDFQSFQLLGSLKDVNSPKALAFEPSKRTL